LRSSSDPYLTIETAWLTPGGRAGERSVSVLIVVMVFPVSVMASSPVRTLPGG
jgi:hypothetical protein